MIRRFYLYVGASYQEELEELKAFDLDYSFGPCYGDHCLTAAVTDFTVLIIVQALPDLTGGTVLRSWV